MIEPDLAGQRPDRRGPGPAARRRWLIDGAIALGVAIVQIGGSHAAAGWHSGPGAPPAPTATTYVLLGIGALALAARRRYPVAVLAITLGAALWAGAGGSRGLAWLSLIVAFFTAVLARRRAAAIASLVIGYIAAVWPPWLISRPGHTSAMFALGLAAYLFALLSIAEVIRISRQRAAAQQRSRAEELRRQAGEERMRIARDLHDVVAHNISVINVQANTALHLMDRQPERARSALSTINDVSKQALVELRSVLGVLRDVDESAPRAPSPSLVRLRDLVDHAAAAGLAVRVEDDGEGSPLPADVDLAAYRIIQEALTNSARHSGGAAATVQVTRSPAALVVVVDDDGAPARGARPAPDAGGRPAGNGIAGMTERAAALGGTLRAGRRPGGGFRVRAWLPLAPAALAGDERADGKQASGTRADGGRPGDMRPGGKLPGGAR
jgi:signal transduction histidine kinase